jgi:hypothetical protein
LSQELRTQNKKQYLRRQVQNGNGSEESPICPKYSVSGVTVSIRIDSLQAERTGENIPVDEVFFDINAKIEEQKKTSSQTALFFSLLLETKPNIAKYSTSGMIFLEGNPQDMSKRLEINPKTKIPQILFTVYQHVFNSIYLLSSLLDTPYPPPDLLHPMQEKIQIIQENADTEATQPTAHPAKPPPQSPPTAAPEATNSPAAK